MQTLLKQYIRDEKNNQPRGVAVAIRRDDGTVDYGFSLLNTLRDKWDKKLGLAIAVARANADEYQLPGVKEREAAVIEAFKRLETRALKYFKDLNPDDVRLEGHLGFNPDQV